MANTLIKSLFVAAFALRAAAAPTPEQAQAPGTASVQFNEKKSGRDYCNWSPDMTNTTDERAPLRSDCQKLADYFDATPADWRTMNYAGADIKDIKVIHSIGTCTFGIRPAHAEEMNGRPDYWIGNIDMASILHYIIEHWSKQYPGGERVQGNGRMQCERDWRVYRNIAWDVYDSTPR